MGTHWSPPPAGLLLYAAVEGELHLHYRVRGREVLVRTLDLARPWREIHAQLTALVMDAFLRIARPESAVAAALG